MSSPRPSRLAALILAPALMIPDLAAAADATRLTPVLVFRHAPPPSKVVMIVLMCAAIAAIVICVRKLMAGPRLAGGSAFVSGLRLGGPLVGCYGAAYTGLNMALGLANQPTPPSIMVLAHGFAEVVLLIGLGLWTGGVAVIANWLVEAKIDRAVLKPA